MLEVALIILPFISGSSKTVRDQSRKSVSSLWLLSIDCCTLPRIVNLVRQKVWTLLDWFSFFYAVWSCCGDLFMSLQISDSTCWIEGRNFKQCHLLLVSMNAHSNVYSYSSFKLVWDPRPCTWDCSCTIVTLFSGIINWKI